MRAIPFPALKILTALALIAALGFVLYAALPPIPAGASSHFEDYDTDDDNLIEIDSIAELQGIRFDHDGDGVINVTNPLVPNWHLTDYDAAFPNRNGNTTSSMGCLSTCIGYELTANLDFAATSTTSTQRNWTNSPWGYEGVFEGNGFTISNMINNDTSNGGFFGTLAGGGRIRNLGLINPTVNGRNNDGPIAGETVAGSFITASWVSGGTTTLTANAPSNVGAFVGRNIGTIIASWSSGNTTGTIASGINVGGLVGENRDGDIIASYAYGRMDANTSQGDNHRGNLVGQNENSATVTDSYCAGTIGGATTTGCIGDTTANSGAITATRVTLAQLQAPTAYSGIFANWNVDLDGDTFPDNPWNFGSSSTYPVPTTAAQRLAAATDYDDDNDGLIEVDSLRKLDAIRHDLNGDGLPDAAANYPAYAGAFLGGDLAATTSLRMGCAAGCIGYELTGSLDFDDDGATGISATDSYPNWNSIGEAAYTAIFEGNGHTISNLTINHAPSPDFAGLFHSINVGGVIRNVGLIDPSVTSSSTVIGILAGGNFANAAGNDGGLIIASYVRGGSVAITRDTGGSMGGLIGASAYDIRASYSTAAVNGGDTGRVNLGGLVGLQDHVGKIIASYAAGPVTGTTTGGIHAPKIGGLVGQASQAQVVITDSYCATGVGSTTSTCVGDLISGAAVTSTGYTTAQLQAPTGYTGIYESWNLSLDADDFPDNPWNFGTASAYPVLNTPTQRQTTVDHDGDDDGLIDVDSLLKLNAIRYDLDGDGLPDAVGNYTAYAGAFAGGDLAATATRMGCVSGCTGYELTGNLDLDAAGDGVGTATTTDPYPNWAPIGGDDGYSGQFSGNGNTITGLTILAAPTVANAGLFAQIAAAGVVWDLGIVNPSVQVGGGNNAGALAGANEGVIRTSYVSGGATTALASASSTIGGLVGANRGHLRAVWSSAAVNAYAHNDSNAGGLAGVHASGTIVASYAYGALATTTGPGTSTRIGGLIGQVGADIRPVNVVDSYCDLTVLGGASSTCIGGYAGADTSTTAIGYSTTDIQTPTGYTGIYENWNINEAGVSGGAGRPYFPWDFGTSSDYPRLNTPDERAAVPWSPPAPPGNGGSNGGGSGSGGDSSPPPAPPAVVTAVEVVETYDAETAHPEIYANAQYEMTATCQTHNPDPETGDPRSATITFDLGSYTGPILLTLSIWRNERYMAYETQDIPLPSLERDGQRATVRVDTDPAQTRFRLDGRRNGLAANLVLGYADCRSDGGP